MKLFLTYLVWLGCSLALYAEQPPTAAPTEGKVLGEALNKAGDRFLVRELRINPADTKEDIRNRHFYRFEFYSYGVLYHCFSFGDQSPPGKVSVQWTDESTATASLIDDWLKVTLNLKSARIWSWERRTD